MNPLSQKPKSETQNPAPQTQPASSSVPPAPAVTTPILPEESEHRSHVQGLRTFSSDMAAAMRDNKGSIIKIAIAEDERRRKDNKEIETAPRKNFLLFFFALLVIALAAAGVYGVLWYKNKSSVVPVAQVVIPQSIIRSDTATTLDVTGKSGSDVVAAVHAIVANPGIQSGMVKNIIVAQSAAQGAAPMRVPASDFLALLQSHAPDQFSRSLSQDFMLGVYQYNTSNLFLVLTGTAHDYLLSGMLGWEPFLLGDVAPLFGIDTSGTNASLLSAPFNDALVENHNVRDILKSDGTPALFYTFLDPDTVFIANDPGTLLEAVRRFNNQ